MVVLVVWVLLSFALAVVIGRSIRLADVRAAAAAPLTTTDLPAGFPPAAGAARR